MKCQKDTEQTVAMESENLYKILELEPGAQIQQGMAQENKFSDLVQKAKFSLLNKKINLQ